MKMSVWGNLGLGLALGFAGASGTSEHDTSVDRDFATSIREFTRLYQEQMDEAEFAAALDTAEALIQAHSDVSIGYVLKFRSIRELEGIEPAAAFVDEHFAKGGYPSGELLESVGMSFFDIESLDRAEGYLTRALELESDLFYATLSMATICLKKEDYSRFVLYCDRLEANYAKMKSQHSLSQQQTIWYQGQIGQFLAMKEAIIEQGLVSEVEEFPVLIVTEEGTGIEALYEQAANGEPEAQNSLGIRYEDGRGVEKDLKLAFYWFERSANQGFPMAESNVGLYYYFGKGVERDLHRAFFWYKRAADHGNDLARFYTGRMYALGQGVDADLEQAMAYFNMATASTDGRTLLETAQFFANPEHEAFYDLDRAIEIVGSGITHDGNNYKIWHQLALLLERNEDFQGAATTLFVGILLFEQNSPNFIKKSDRASVEETRERLYSDLERIQEAAGFEEPGFLALPAEPPA